MHSHSEDFHLAVILQNIHDETEKIRNMTLHELNTYISNTQFEIQLLKVRACFNWINFIFWESNEAAGRRAEKIRDLEFFLNYAIKQKPILVPIPYK